METPYIHSLQQRAWKHHYQLVPNMKDNFDDSDDDSSTTSTCSGTGIDIDESNVVAALARQVEDCVELLKNKNNADNDNGNDNAKLQSQLSSLLSDVREADAKCSQIQQRINEAQCDILVIREEAVAAERAKNMMANSVKRVDADIASNRELIASRQKSIDDKNAKISDIRATNEALQKDIDSGSGWRPDQEAERGSLITAVEKGRNELESAQSQLDTLRSQVLSMEDSVRHAEASRDEAFAELKATSDKIDTLNKDKDISQQRKNRMESDLEDVKKLKKECEDRLSEKNNALQQEQERLAVSERRLKEAKVTMESLSRKNDITLREIKSLCDKRQRQVQSNTEAESTNTEMRLTAQSREKELHDIAKDITAMKKQHDLVTERIDATENDRMAYESEVDRLKLEISKIENSEIKLARKENESHRRQIDALEHESAMLQRSLDLTQKDASVVHDLIKTNESTVKNLDNELSVVVAANKNHQTIIQNLEKEKKRHENDGRAAQKHLGEAIDTLKEQEALIDELQTKAQDEDTQIKRKQTVYEKMQLECHTQSTALVSSQEEMDRVRRRCHILDRHMNQLKDEISQTTNAFAYEHSQRVHADNVSSNLRQEASKLRQQIAATELSIRNNDSVSTQFLKAIEDEDAALKKLRNEYSAIMSERDITCDILVQKREDVLDLKQKIKSQQSLLHHGEVMYLHQKEQMAMISDEIKSLKARKEELDARSTANNVIVEQCTVLERDLRNERAKRKILSNELGRPINIHRWRFLEHSDPDRYAMLLKAHNLQRKILETGQYIVEKEVLLQEEEMKYSKIKSSIGHMSTVVDLRAQLAHYSSAIKTKTSEMEKLNVELLVSRRKMEALQRSLLDIEDHRKGLATSRRRLD